MDQNAGAATNAGRSRLADHCVDERILVSQIWAGTGLGVPGDAEARIRGRTPIRRLKRESRIAVMRPKA